MIDKEIQLFFEKIAQHFDNELPFVLYRKPNEVFLNAFLQKNNTAYFTKNYTEKGFVFAPFDNEMPSYLIPKEQSDFFHVKSDFSDDALAFETFLVEENVDNRQEQLRYINLINKAIGAIEEKSALKIVTSRKQVLPITKPLIANALLSIFKKLNRLHTAAFVYVWYHPKEGLWVGATPETLFELDNNELKTMALAGTQIFKSKKDVSWGEKEKQEQQWVTFFIHKQLQDISSIIKVDDSETIRAGNLLHLRTMLNAGLKPELEYPLQILIEKLHPTPAVCGLPQPYSKQFVLQHEAYDREFYTGFLGEINLKSTREQSACLFVNLRCMQLKKNAAWIYVGGGITKDSIAEKEWEETVNKTATMRSVL